MDPFYVIINLLNYERLRTMTIAKDSTDIEWSLYFYYDITSPTFLRHAKDKFTGIRHTSKIASKGDIAGWYPRDNNDREYRTVKYQGKEYPVSRVIYELITGIKLTEYEIIDHKDGNTGNNSIDNLRIATVKLNGRNRRLSSNSITGINRLTIDRKKGVDINVSASWLSISGEEKNRSFSILKYGKDEAMKLAKEFLALKFDELNELGEGYTDRHGKSNKEELTK